jgi:hypothetical protein
MRAEMDKDTPKLDDYVIQQITDKVKLLPVVLEQSHDHEIKVACISFGYKNR